MKALTIETVKNNGWLIFEAIAGSKAYGLNNEKSDTDIRGVFILPKHLYYGLTYVEQVNNETNDIVYYELKRFMELLAKNNPNILEMLNIPESCVLYKHPIIDSLEPDLVISKLCEKTFANYAFTQIKKAFGLEKKILNPVEEVRKSVLDFCYVYQNKEAISLITYLQQSNLIQSNIGLASIAHLKDCYNMFHDINGLYSGVMRREDANEVSLSSIPKEAQSIGLLYFNRDGYSTYCKKYKEYWDWVAKRNDERFKTTMSHGKGYDSKNMMHVFRLLFMAKEIATENVINVHRKDRDYLLAIKAGHFEYDDLVVKAEALKEELPFLFQQSSLQEEPDIEKLNSLLFAMREAYYSK
jgi:predicted nucleotidyltransferase